MSGVAFSTCAILDDYSILIYFLPTIRVPEINCNNGRVYKVCGPISDETCSGLVAEPIRTATDLCIEGCYCPNDSALHKNQCIGMSVYFAPELTNRESKCRMIATLGQFCVVSQHPLVLRVWCSLPLGLNKKNYLVPFHDCYDLSKPTWVPKLLRRSCEEFFREMKWGE